MSKTSWLSIPQDVKPVLLFQGAANAVACDVVSTKNIQMLWFVVTHSGATDTDLTLTVTEATNVAAGTNQTITQNVPIWRDNDAGTTSDTLVRQSDGTAITIDPATQNAVVAVIQVDPTKLSAGYDCVYLADSGGNAANVVNIIALCQMRSAQATPETVITD